MGSAERIWALVMRHIHIWRSSVMRLIDSIYWPADQMVMWGFMTQYLPGVEVTVYDNDAERAEAFVTSRGLRSAPTFDALLACSDVMDVCLPTPVHAEVGVACLAAGKPTLVEKPFARTVGECERMIAAARDSGNRWVTRSRTLISRPKTTWAASSWTSTEAL